MRMFSLLIVLLGVAVLPLAAFDHSHSDFTKLLSRYVDDRGRVDYKSWKAKDMATLDAYLDQLGSPTKAEIRTWSRNQKLAYYINAYNAYTIKAILQNYPIEAGGFFSSIRFPDNSIRQIDGVWKEMEWDVGGTKLTLWEIEHDKIRDEIGEPLIHFAVNCASIGCPHLTREAYAAPRVMEQLRTDADQFINSPNKVTVDRRDKELRLSPIFKWFTEDFDEYSGVKGYGKYNGVVSLLVKYLPESEARVLRGGDFDIEWLDYDWSLNEQ